MLNNRLKTQNLVLRCSFTVLISLQFTVYFCNIGFITPTLTILITTIVVITPHIMPMWLETKDLTHKLDLYDLLDDSLAELFALTNSLLSYIDLINLNCNQKYFEYFCYSLHNSSTQYPDLMRFYNLHISLNASN